MTDLKTMSTQAVAEWLDEMEGFHFIRERFLDDCEHAAPKTLISWLETAWQLGYEHGKNSTN